MNADGRASAACARGLWQGEAPGQWGQAALGGWGQAALARGLSKGEVGEHSWRVAEWPQDDPDLVGAFETWGPSSTRPRAQWG